MVEVSFKEISLEHDEHSVFIKGKSHNHQLQVKMSILQFAKICGTDGELAQEVEADFGSIEHEEKCIETKQLVTLFPNIPVWDKELIIEDQVTIKENTTDKTIELTVKDIVGWSNEGITLSMPQEFYNLHVKPLQPIQLSISPFTLYIKSKKSEKQQSL